MFSRAKEIYALDFQPRKSTRRIRPIFTLIDFKGLKLKVLVLHFRLESFLENRHEGCSCRC